jgi:hypothetical protein
MGIFDRLFGSHEQLFHQANAAASILGIDAWAYHWKRLQAEPTNPSRWFHAMQSCGREHIGEVADFALHVLPLASIAQGPGKEMGMGPEYQSHQCLDFVLQGLQAYPGSGVQLIEAGLNSPVVSNRNGAVRVLATWGKSNWPQGIESMLAVAMVQEPDEKVRESIQKVIDGKKLD